MSSIGLSTWLLMGMVVVGVYVLPSVTAKFQGSHTMEFNGSSNGNTNATGMNCGACHEYIESELNATFETGQVITAHITALNDVNYANDDNQGSLGGFLEIGNFSVAADAFGEVCPLCHAAEVSLEGSHTQVVTRLCTDVDCHGYNSSATSQAPVFGGQNITTRLNGSNSNDVHGTWYSAMEEKNSNRPLANGTEFSRHQTDGIQTYGQGYLTCMACHTHFGMNLNISRPNAYNINLTINADGEVNITGAPAVNGTNVTETFSQKLGTSVW